MPSDKPAATEAGGPIAWVVHGAFAAVIERLRLSLVLSTLPNHVVFLGSVDGEFTASATRVAQPLGIAAETGRIALASARTVVVFANAARLAAHYPGRKDYYDAFYIPRTIHFTGDCQMHDMIFQGPAVIGVNTAFSCICRIDGEFSFTPLWIPPFITQLRGEDRCHLNGFAGQDGELYYLTALSATDTPGGWRTSPDTTGILFDARCNVILRSDLCMPHSPRLIHDHLYVLNGGEGELLRIERATGHGTIVARLPGFAHGLCHHGDILFVGLSQNRVTRSKTPPPLARRVEMLTAGVAAVDARTGEVIGVLEFTSGVSEVYDVQTLPGVRRAGMQNLLATDGYIGIETPNSVFWNQRPPNDLPHMADVIASGHYGIKVTPAG